MSKAMRIWDCGERDEEMGLVERDEGRGLWGKDAEREMRGWERS